MSVWLVPEVHDSGPRDDLPWSLSTGRAVVVLVPLPTSYGRRHGQGSESYCGEQLLIADWPATVVGGG